MTDEKHEEVQPTANKAKGAQNPPVEDLVLGDSVQGDKIVGDSYSVDQVSGGAVAIGAGARVEINQYSEIIVRPDSIEDLPPAPGEPPFKGLAYFKEDDAGIFFGREELSRQIETRLQRKQFLAVIGASGSGKSSLLRAGVAPLLRRQNWLIKITSPSVHPLERLAGALTKEDASLGAAAEVLSLVQNNPRALPIASNQLAAEADTSRFLLVVDQFEELFTLCRDEGERKKFVDHLLNTAEDGGVLTVLIGLRADFYDHCAKYDGLRELVSQEQIYIGSMRQEDLVRVIAEPAKRGGWQFVDGLVEQILEDVGQEPGRLPLLSHALLETWELRRGTVMTLGGYRAAGGVEGAIAKTAENTLATFDPGQLQVAEGVFLALTELGEGSEDTRRIATREELARGNAQSLDTVLEDLVRARLITIDGDHVEVAHEALIRRWPRLGDWLRDNRERLRLERQLLRDAQEWVFLDRDIGALYRGARLAQVREWQSAHKLAELTGLEQEFIEASINAVEAEERLARRRRNGIWAGLIITAVILGILAFLAFRQSRVALSRQLAAQAVSLSGSQGDLSLLLGLQAYQIDTSFETENGLLTALQANPQVVAYLHGPQKRVQKVLFSPDGQMAAAASDDNFIYVWNLATKQLDQEPILLHSEAVNDLAFNGSGNLMVSGGADGQVVLWDLPNRQKIALAGNDSPIRSLAFAGGNSFVAFGDEAGSLSIFNPNSQEIEKRLYLSDSPINSITYNAENNLIAAANDRGQIGLMDAATQEWAKPPLVGDQNDGIWSVAFTPDGRFLVSGGENGRIEIWNVETGEPVGLPVQGHDGAVYSVAFDPTGRRMVSSSEGGSVILWDARALTSISAVSIRPVDAQTIELIQQFFGHSTAVQSAAIAPQGGENAPILSGGSDGQVILWNPSAESPLASIFDHNQFSYWRLAASPNGRWLAASRCTASALPQAIQLCTSGSVQLFDLTTGQLTDEIADVAGGSDALAFSADSDRLAYAGCAEIDAADGHCKGGLIYFWDPVIGGIIGGPLAGHQGRITSLSYVPNRDLLVSSSMDGTALVWNLDTGELEFGPLVGHDGPIWDAAVNKDGSRLATAGEDKQIIIWNLATGEEIEHLDPHTERVLAVDFSPEEPGLLAAGSWDNLVSLLNVARKDKETAYLLGHTRAVLAVTFRKGGQWLASGSGAGDIVLWDTARQQRLGMPLIEHTAGVSSLAFDPQGSKLYSGGNDGRLIAWDTNIADWQQKACARANRSLSEAERDFHLGENVLDRLLAADPCSK